MIMPEDEMMEWTIDQGYENERIDKYLVAQLGEDYSRTQVQLWLKQGNITVNGHPIKANYKLADGDQVVLWVPEPVQVDIMAEPLPLSVVYEDGDVIVIDKPRGMVVHPAPGHPTGTLVNALLFHCHDLSGINGEIRPGIVHRIDKDTSGLLVAAKHDQSHTSLAGQLKEHQVTRRYLALVHGVIAHDQGTVDAPIGRDPYDRKLFVVTEKNSKHAVTHFTVIERFAEYTFVELKLETGRTHQIRVHMKFIGHPIVGDPAYGRNKGITMDGQALHAAVLGFIHPLTGEYLQFESALPSDMSELLENLRAIGRQ